MDANPGSGFSNIWFLRSKLCPPVLPQRALERPRLNQALRVAVERPITCITAPAGFGKTTLLGQLHALLKAEGAAVAWLTCDEDDGEPSRLITYLAAALMETGLSVGLLADAVRNDLHGMAPRAALELLLAAAERTDKEVTLILDDVHELQDKPSGALLAHLVERLPAGLHLVMAARARPDLRLQKLRLQGALSDISHADLRFTLDEAEALIGDEARADISALLDRTEGWAAALELARGLIRSDFRVESSGLAAVGHSADVARYLAEEILARLRPEVRNFLLLTSIADRICGDLADALTGGFDGGAILEELEEEIFLVVPLDKERRWYRYHRVLRDFLEDRLVRTGLAPHTKLHRRAAEWFAGEGLLAEAIRHARRTDDESLALRLVEEVGGWRLALRGGMPVLRAFRDLEVGVAERFPRVRLGQLYLAAQEGLIGEARSGIESLRRATEDFQIGGDGEHDAELASEARVVDLIIAIYEDERLPLDEIVELNARADLLPRLDPNVRAIIGNFLCFAHYDAANYDECRRTGEAAWATSRAHRAFYAENYVYAYVGLASLWQGCAIKAGEKFEEMRQRAKALPGGSQEAIANLLKAETLYEQDDLDTARQLLDEAMPRVETSDGWFDIFASGYATAVSLASATGSLDATVAALDHWDASASRLGLVRLQRLAQARRVTELARYAALAAAQRAWDETKLGEMDRSFTVASARVAAPTLLARARLDIALGRPAAARAELWSLEGRLRKLRLDHWRVPALALLSQCDPVNATQWLAQALEEGHARGLYRSLLDNLDAAPGALIQLSARTHGLSAGAAHLLARLCGNRRGVPAQADTASGGGGPHARHCDALLTNRESEVMSCLADGLSNKEIGTRLGIAEGTVKIHRRSIYRKLGVSTRSGVVSASRQLSVRS